MEDGKVDHYLALQVGQIEQYWRSVIKRLMKVLIFLCHRELAIRGDNEIIGSIRNGNYLDMLELQCLKMLKISF